MRPCSLSVQANEFQHSARLGGHTARNDPFLILRRADLARKVKHIANLDGGGERITVSARIKTHARLFRSHGIGRTRGSERQAGERYL